VFLLQVVAFWFRGIETLKRKIIHPVHFKSAQPTVEDFKTPNILGLFWPFAALIIENPMTLILYLFNYE